MTLPIVERFSSEIISMAKAYGLGSPERRAIITALDHARAVVGSDRLHEEKLGDSLPSILYEAPDNMDEQPRSAEYYEQLAEHLRFGLAMRQLEIGGHHAEHR